MLMSITELKKYIDIDVPDSVLINKLGAIEMMIRGYCNNNFHSKIYTSANIVNGEIISDYVPFIEQDTVQVEGSPASDGLYTISNGKIAEPIRDCERVRVTLVRYPLDVKQGAVSLMEYELKRKDKEGITSETISRHSVTYSDANSENSVLGYPKTLIGFLKPYRKVKF